MNVTEAVDSLSAMFHPSAQLTQPHLPVTKPSYHIEEFIFCIYSKTESPLFKHGFDLEEFCGFFIF